MRFSAVFAAGLLCAAAAAQGPYKCKDAAGRITYSDTDCELIGLTSAGEVKGRASVAPAYKPPPASTKPGAGAKQPAKQPAKPAATAGRSPARKDEPAAPERHCFVVKSAKGNVVRCNEVPPGEKLTEE